MWISFLFFSVLALLVHWKVLAEFWGLTFLGLVLSAYTFSYHGTDAELYHIPMQILLREGWNPIFDSSVQKFSEITDTSAFFAYHTLFLPKTVALCGALIAKASGLWIANSFLGYLLLFVLFRTSFVFAEKAWNCGRALRLLFAVSISFHSVLCTMFDGLIDFHVAAALTISLFSIVLYLWHRKTHDLLLAVIATVICGTSKTTGLINCLLLWGLFVLYSWKKKEAYWSVSATAILIVWIGMSPFVTSWIQYGSPFYPLMTFDPRIAPIDITDDFFANADGDLMGRLARFVYAWISPGLAKRACAVYYRKADFNPVFNLNVTQGVGGYGASLNCLFTLSIVLLALAKKNLVSFACLFLLATLVLCPVKYIGYERYFPQAWTIVPLGFYQFCSFPPSWLMKKEKAKRALRCCLYSVLGVYSLLSVAFDLAYQTKCIIIEGKRQSLLTSFQKEGIVFEIPRNTNKGLALSQRLVCGNVNCAFSQQDADLSSFKYGKHRSIDMNDPSFLHFKRYYLDLWLDTEEYFLNHNPSSLLRFKWRNIFKHPPHPLFYRRPVQSPVLNAPENNKTQPFFQNP